MSIPATLRRTEEDREGNPKAVFFGELPEFSNSIIQYLNERRVELFSAKTWEEIFYGDYFIYIGALKPVKTFLEGNTRALPQSLLLITDTSDTSQIETLGKQYPKLKICFLDPKIQLTKAQTDNLFGFFLGGSNQYLNLRQITSQATERKVVSTTDISAEKAIEDTPAAAEITLNLSQKHTQAETEVKITDKKEAAKTETKTTKTRHLKFPILSAAATILFLLLFLPLFGVVVFGAVGTYQLLQADRDLQAGDIERITKRSDTAEISFAIAGKFLDMIFPVFEVSRTKGVYISANKFLETAAHLGRAYDNLAQVAISGHALVKTILGSAAPTPVTASISQVKNHLEMADDELAQAQAAYKSYAILPILQMLPQSQSDKFKERLLYARQQIQTAQALISLAPELLGIYGPRTYLMILQNNMESRPTGGFIGSYALLEFDGGVLKNTLVNDIYTADGQLLGHVPPPEPVRVYLAQEHWYMRDSNWDPNFADSARQLLWFLEKETGVIADGVIAVDINLAENILEFLGPVELPDFHLSLDKNNLFEVLHAEIESDFFPGSNKKADFLGALFRQILERLPNLQTTFSSKWLSSLERQLAQKSLQLYFVNPKIQEVVNQNNWLAKIPPDDPCPKNNCKFDYLAVIDANLGVNKANAFVERQIQGSLTISENAELTQKITVRYQNSSSSDNKTQGDYKNYLRLYLPKDYEIAAVQINNLPLKLDSEILSASESTARISQEKNSRVVDIFLTVPKTAERSVDIIATRRLEQTRDLKYIYQIVKQPGYRQEKVGFVFNLPTNFTLAQNSLPGQVAGVSTLVTDNQITYNTTLTQDANIELDLIKK